MVEIYNLEKNEKVYVEVDEYGVPCSKECATLGYFIGTIVVNGKYAFLDIPMWDHKDFKVFHDNILQLVQVIYILYLYE